MKRTFFLALSYLLFFPQCYGEQTSKIIVGYAVMGDLMSLEDSATVRWLQNHESFTPQIINVSKRGRQQSAVDVLWVHVLALSFECEEDALCPGLQSQCEKSSVVRISCLETSPNLTSTLEEGAKGERNHSPMVKGKSLPRTKQRGKHDSTPH